MRPLGRPIGIWIATAYMVGLLVLNVSDPGSPLWLGSPFMALLIALLLLGIILLMSLNRWAVPVTAVNAGMEATFYLVYVLDPSGVVPLLGLGSRSHDVYVVPIESNVAPLVYLAVAAAIPLYSAWLWRKGDLA